MQVVRTERELRDTLRAARRQGRSIEFVPTMGAFHEGHLELMRRARRSDGELVVSIFVNPTQFDRRADFDSYPRNFDADAAVAEAKKVDILFVPPPGVMYPGGAIDTTVDVGPLGRILEGEHRSGHFAGVATVCAKLFNLVEPDRVYLGQKDAQQVAVLRRMVADLDFDLELVVCPTVREPDGLALSSRNVHLGPDDRRAARALSEALLGMAARSERGVDDVQKLRAYGREVIARQPAVSLQYLEIVDPDTFESVDRITGRALAVAAAWVGPVRLIDNVFVGTG